MPTLGVAVVGAGYMGRRHAQIYHDLSETHVAIVCDVLPDVARALAETVGARWTTDLDEAIGDPGVQVVSICTSDNQHLAPALLSARHRKPYLVEKPVAT